MKPPPIRVAIITGQDVIHVRSGFPLTVKPVDGTEKTFEGSKVSIRIGGSSASKKEKWVWCANFGDRRAAERFAGDVALNGINTRLWPVGLSPVEGEWRPRSYRVLAGPFKEFSPPGQPGLPTPGFPMATTTVEIELPAEIPASFLHIEDFRHQKATFNQSAILTSQDFIEFRNVTVGSGFHWQHDEDIRLPSPVWVAVNSTGQLCAGVELDVEDYLTSVNSSEMPAESPLEFLKAQVVAARSWLFANWDSHHPGEPYTVCAGDHCQCYYGSSYVQPPSRRAVDETRGEVLVYNQRICDARYAKSCGGVTEPAANVWPFVEEPYLGHQRDLPGGNPLDLSDERSFREFQNTFHDSDACCAPGFASLPEGLAELANLYRWEERISNRDLVQIIRSKTRCDLGRILEVIPGRRGPSGRLIAVEVIGSQGRLSLTPELEIRRVLHRYHLPSSAFWIENDVGGAQFVFHGLGWGHGVGMCQLGAAGLATRGYDYNFILIHYYPNTSIEKIY